MSQFSFLKTAALCTLLSSSAFGLILLDDTMDNDEQKITGVYSLDHNQRAALEDWLNKNFVLKTPEQQPVVPELTLAENINNGRKLKLSDGAVYEIAPYDVTRASGWITPFPIQVLPSGDPRYPFKIVNKNTGHSLKAKMISPGE